MDSLIVSSTDIIADCRSDGEGKNCITLPSKHS